MLAVPEEKWLSSFAKLQELTGDVEEIKSQVNSGQYSIFSDSPRLKGNIIENVSKFDLSKAGTKGHHDETEPAVK